MIKIKVDYIETELVPWKSREELSKRISDNFDWNSKGDPIPAKLTYAYPPNGHCSEIWPLDELRAIITQLPEKHELNQEIIEQTKKNLVEIIAKSPDELRGHTPKYLNSFWVGDVRNFEKLFDATKNAAYHVIKNPVFTDTVPKEEDEIMFSVAKGMLGYAEKNPDETLEFINILKDKQLVPPFMFTGYMELRNKEAIKAYFDLFNQVDGQDDFILDNIKRGVGFKFIGKRLKRFFPDYDFQKEINQSNPILREQLEKIFN